MDLSIESVHKLDRYGVDVGLCTVAQRSGDSRRPRSLWSAPRARPRKGSVLSLNNALLVEIHSLRSLVKPVHERIGCENFVKVETLGKGPEIVQKLNDFQ
jgi:hypothetical protein